MFDEPPALPAPPPIAAGSAVPLPAEQRAEGAVIIDLTQLVPPPPPAECASEVPDPFHPEIVVCSASGPSPRLGPMIGPVDDGFGSAIPRARIRLSERAEAEANLAKTPVGGVDADGAEVRLKIDF